jgi:glycerol uptake facilitator-like aquaporin
MLGTGLLTMMAVFAVLAPKSSKLDISEVKQKVFAILITATALVLAIVVCQGIEKMAGMKKLTGHVNPAITLA